MGRSQISSRIALVLGVLMALLIAGMPVAQGAAQGVTSSYTSVLTGAVVQASGGWAIDTESTGVESGTEVVSALGPDNGVLLSWLPAGTDIVGGRDFMLGELATLFDNVVSIDKGAYGNVSYSLDIGNAQGVEFGIFSIFLGQRPSGYVEYYLYLGPVSTFADGFASAQRNITVGGQSIFRDIDGGGLQAFLVDHAGAAGGTVTEPDGNVIAEERQERTGPTEVPAPTTVTENAAEDTGYVAILRGEIAYVQTTLDEFINNFAALQGDDVDHAIAEINRISDEWLAYPNRAAGIVAPAGYERVDAGYRQLADDVNSLGNSWRNAVSALQADSGFEEALQVFTDDMNTVQQGLGSLEALLDEAEGLGAPTAAPTATDAAPTAPASTQGGDTRRSPRDRTRSGNESETGAGPSGRSRTSGTTATAGDYADLGLLADGDYVSPQQGVQITWDETWMFDEAYPSPIESDVESEMDKIVISWVDDMQVSIFVTVGPSHGVRPQDLVEIWASDDFLDEASQETERLLMKTGRSGGAALLSAEVLSEGTEVVVLRSATCADPACETLVSTTMIGVPESFGGAYRDARSGVMVEGQRLFDVFTPREVLDALGGGR